MYQWGNWIHNYQRFLVFINLSNGEKKHYQPFMKTMIVGFTIIINHGYSLIYWLNNNELIIFLTI